VVPASGGAAGETLPVYASDNFGTTWHLLSSVKAPAYLSKDPKYAKLPGRASFSARPR